jgi:hypothetical protein
VRRSVGTAIVVVVGLILLADALVANPSLDAIAGLLTDYLVLVAAGAALAGAIALFVRHGGDLLLRRGDRIGSGILLMGLITVLVLGLRPGSAGASDSALRWVVAALIVPIGASVGGLLVFFLLRGAERGMRINPREATLLVTLAAASAAMLLPLGGATGSFLADLSSWLLEGPVAAVFRGLLIGVASAAAITAARFLFGVEQRDE